MHFVYPIYFEVSANEWPGGVCVEGVRGGGATGYPTQGPDARLFSVTLLACVVRCLCSLLCPCGGRRAPFLRRYYRFLDFFVYNTWFSLVVV